MISRFLVHTRSGSRLAVVVVVLAASLAVLVLATTIRVSALPASDLDAFYFDLSYSLVAQHSITCNGAHYDWGDRTLAEPGYYSEYRTACSSGGGSTHCVYTVDELGNKTLDYCG